MIQSRKSKGFYNLYKDYGDIADAKGNTLLHIACQNGNKKVHTSSTLRGA